MPRVTWGHVCFADPQVEGRGALRIWVYGDTDNALVSSDQRLMDCDVLDLGCDGEPTVRGRYVCTATDGICGLSGCRVDSFPRWNHRVHGRVHRWEACCDIDNDTATSVYRHGGDRSLFQSCSSGTLNASSDTRFDRGALAVERRLDAGRKPEGERSAQCIECRGVQ